MRSPSKKRVKPIIRKKLTKKKASFRRGKKLRLKRAKRSLKAARGRLAGRRKVIPQPAEVRTSDDYNRGFEKGMADGIYTGGDGIVDTALPGDLILPEVSIHEIVAAGVGQMMDRVHHLLQPVEIGGELLQALETRTPMSVIRLGDGELLTLAQGVLMTPEEVMKQGPFLSYAGIDVPDYHSRDRLLEAIRRATFVGIPRLRLRNFQPLAFSVLRSFGMDYRQLRLTDSLINYHLYQHGFLSKLLAGRRVLLVGNKAPGLADVFAHHGVHIAGVISPVQGVKDSDRVMGELAKASPRFDIALISAGISAVILASRTAAELGKVAIDFGHLADSMIKGEAPYF